jgi:hypothetical protein
MTTTNLVLAIRALCEGEVPEITGQGIEESNDQAALTSLIDLGALTHIGNAETILCLGCDAPHSIGVEYAGDGLYRAFCPDSGYQQVQPDTLRRFVVDENWIASSIATALGLNFVKASIPSTITRVGRARFGPYACELFVGRRLSEKTRFEEAKRIVAGQTGKAPAIIMTLTPLDLIPGEAPPRCALIPLEDVLQVSASKIMIEEGPIHAALRGTDHRFRGEAIGFVFSPGFRSAVVGDQEYSFTDKQALVVEALYQARKSGAPRLHQTEIQGAASTNQRVGQLFAGHPAYGSLIKYDGAGYYWLDL